MNHLPRPYVLSAFGPCLRGLALVLASLVSVPGRAADPPQAPTAGKTAPAEAAPTAKEIGEQVRAALQDGKFGNKDMSLGLSKKNKLSPGPVTTRTPPQPALPPNLQQGDRQYVRARTYALTGRKPAAHGPAEAAAVAHEEHWSYEGRTGPDNWSRLKPEFGTCAAGRRQSPIHIEDHLTLQGPAEPIRFSYQPSKGVVVNNGHTIQVDVSGDNTITVRDATYKLVQFHFHHPSEERINNKSFPMVAHLVHRNEQGQLAVVAVLFNLGTANSLINKVWTYMPIDVNDSVRMPEGLVTLNELLPLDQRYYQFMGSLTTPPCTEGVLWLVLKQPVTISAEQLRLFDQLFPNNARPVQPLNGRPVREAQ